MYHTHVRALPLQRNGKCSADIHQRTYPTVLHPLFNSNYVLIVALCVFSLTIGKFAALACSDPHFKRLHFAHVQDTVKCPTYPFMPHVCVCVCMCVCVCVTCGFSAKLIFCPYA